VQRIANLILRLSSPFDGEVVAAARALDRALRSTGRDWHELVDVLTRPVLEPPPARPPALYEIAIWLSDCGRLNAWECEFIPSVLSRLRAGMNLTEKQEHCLRRTWAKYERFWTC
jgi:hypothetical protein